MAKTGLGIICPADFRPGPSFNEGDVTVTGFGGAVEVVFDFEKGGELIVTIGDTETFRQTYTAGRHELKRDRFLSDALWTGGGTLIVRFQMVEEGATYERVYRYTDNYHREYQENQQAAYRIGRQKQLLGTHQGRSALRTALDRIIGETAPERCYVADAVIPRKLSSVTREFLALGDFADVTDDQILGAFFEADAFELARKVPNPFWFARALWAAIEVQGDLVSFQKVSHDVLVRAMLKLSEGTKARMDGFDPINSELISALKVAEGVLVISRSGQQLVENTVFLASAGR